MISCQDQVIILPLCGFLLKCACQKTHHFMHNSEREDDSHLVANFPSSHFAELWFSCAFVKEKNRNAPWFSKKRKKEENKMFLLACQKLIFVKGKTRDSDNHGSRRCSKN